MTVHPWYGLVRQEAPAPGCCAFALVARREHRRPAFHVVLEHGGKGEIVAAWPACQSHAAWARVLGLRVLTHSRWRRLQVALSAQGEG